MGTKKLRGIQLQLPIGAHSLVENVTYFIIWISCFGYSTAELIRFCREFYLKYMKLVEQKKVENSLFKTGWLGFDYFSADRAWSFWPRWFGVITLYSSGFVLVSFIGRRLLSKQLHLLLCVIATVAILSWLTSWGACAELFGLSTLTYVITMKLRSRLLLWVVVIGVMSSLVFDENLTIFKVVLPITASQDDLISLLMGALTFQLLRLASLGTDAVTGSSKPSILKFYHFTLYLPSLFTGPCQSFADFEEQSTNPPWSKRLKTGFRQLVQTAACGIAIYIILHLVYPQLMIENVATVSGMNHWSLYSLNCWTNIFYQVTFIVIYGVGQTLALFDGYDIAGPILQPIVLTCYSYAAVYSAYDPGIHRTLLAAIYIPLGGSRHGLGRQYLAAAASFSYMCYWHGGSWRMISWCGMNFLGIQVQSFCRHLEKSKPLRRLRVSVGEAMWRRLYCVACAPVHLWGLASTVILGANLRVLRVYFNKFISNGSPVLWAVMSVVLYAHVQVCVEYQRRRLLADQRRTKRSD